MATARDDSIRDLSINIGWLADYMAARPELIHPFCAQEIIEAAKAQANRSGDDDVDEDPPLEDLFGME